MVLDVARNVDVHWTGLPACNTINAFFGISSNFEQGKTRRHFLKRGNRAGIFAKVKVIFVQVSQANPDGENLFSKYGVKQCLNTVDSGGFVTDCLVLDDLWKLRFWEYPLQMDQGQHAVTGWAGMKLRPDDRQLLLLRGYGMEYLTDVAIGENMFRLLKDMGDEEWVANYRSGS